MGLLDEAPYCLAPYCLALSSLEDKNGLEGTELIMVGGTELIMSGQRDGPDHGRRRWQLSSVLASLLCPWMDSLARMIK